MAPNEAKFIAFGGMRGALGMALGLLIVDNAEDCGISAQDASRAFFYIGGVVALSLFINGTCATMVLEYLDLGSNNSVQNMLVIDQIKRKLRHKMNRMVDKMEKEMDIAPDDMMDVRMSCSILRPSQIEIDDLMMAQYGGLPPTGTGVGALTSSMSMKSGGGLIGAHNQTNTNSFSFKANNNNNNNNVKQQGSHHLSQRLAEAHMKAAADGTLNGQITPHDSGHTSIYTGHDSTQSHMDDDMEDDEDDDLGGIGDDTSDRDISEDSARYDDSWLNPSQIINQKKIIDKNGVPVPASAGGISGSIGPYSDNYNHLSAVVNGGGYDTGRGNGTDTASSSLSTNVSTPGLALQANTNANTNANANANANAGAGIVVGRPNRSSTHTGITSPTMQNMKLLSDNSSAGNGNYDYAADTIREARRQTEQLQNDGGGQIGGRTRTWSVGSYLGAANREGRASRYSKASNAPNSVHQAMTSERAARYSTMSTLLDPTRRKGNKINKEMLAYVRTLFLEIVRVKYWKLIENGKLPRNCYSTQYLLYSVDVGIDKATYNPTRKPPGQSGIGNINIPGFRTHSTNSQGTEIKEEDGLADWGCIAYDIDKNNMIGRKIFMYWENLPWYFGGNIASSILETLDSDLENRQVYMLSAFIEAHEHAQRKIHSFVGVDIEGNEDEHGLNDTHTQLNSDGSSNNRKRTGTDDTDNIYMRTPEEIQVRNESQNVLTKAREALESIEDEVVSEIRSKQAAMTILSKEVELVKTMCEEGLLTNVHAESFLEEIQEDREIIDEDSTGMFRRRRTRRHESGVDYGVLSNNESTHGQPLLNGKDDGNNDDVRDKHIRNFRNG
jgi:hypothetical protein